MEQDIIHNQPKALLKWMGFLPGQQALFINAGHQLEYILKETLEEADLAVTDIHYSDLGAITSRAPFDYVFIGIALEYCKGGNSAMFMLETVRRFLKPDARLLLFLDNRLGIRYFCGDADPCTGIIFDGIENYPLASKKLPSVQRRQLFDKAEITVLLESAGFKYRKFYSVFPDLSGPQLLIADGYTPNEELDIRLFPAYHKADSVFLMEETLYSSLIHNQLFHSMANAFLIECAVTENGKNNFEKADYVTVSMNRGKQRAFSTIIQEQDRVIKKPFYDAGFRALENMVSNTSQLQQRGIPVIEGEIEKDSYVSAYIKGDSLLTVLRNLLRRNLMAFLAEMDKLWQYIIDSSEAIAYQEVDWEKIDPAWDELEKKGISIDRGKWRRIAMADSGASNLLGPILKNGFIDLIVLNAIMTSDGPVFFDQEFKLPQIPARCVMLKNIDIIYRDQSLENIYPSKMLYDRYGITEHEEFYRSIENNFWKKLVNFDAFAEYRSTRERNSGAVNMNRFCMNYPERVRSAMLTDIFSDAKGKELYVFGAGKWADKFIAMYRHEYIIAGIVDNNPQKHGKLIYDLQVLDPKILRSLDHDRSKVIVCVKDCALIVRQLLEWGIRNIGVYNAWMAYPLYKNRQPNLETYVGIQKKKYHLGYVAGVFDLFHIGHLNLLRRAKEECDYLIAGVVTDEGVRKNKHTEPVIPFEERLAVVDGCRYVDEAVEIPLLYCDTQDAWRKFQFDVQFSGSDYENDPVWLEKQRFLRAHGADLIFFPYTESTSSTKIKRKMANMSIQ